MPSLHPQSITDFSTLLEYLRDELDWPLLIDADLEEISFSYNQHELQLSDSTANKLSGGEILQLQPMVEGQKWGVFFVRFESTHLYVSALREILRRLVKQRANLPAFAHEDLLFICATGNFEQFTFAHFQKRETGQPILETFGWKRGDAHVRTLCEWNFPQLKWKDAFETDADEWRKQWRSAFDVSAVTQKFFDEYETHFRAVEESVQGFPRTEAGKEARNAWTQKIFNRLLFIAFVQKKGWLTPPATAPEGHNYLERLWHDYAARKAELEAESFYTTRLKPLFAALNTRSAAITEFVGKVPYLNGGLFDTEEDGRVDPPNLKVDDEAIRKIIFELFARYNFTVQESTPLDINVAVDPEMLGKVFEKLILKRDRKSGGSFYTPRVVVTFMCREALKRFLGDKYAPLIERGDTEGIGVSEATTLLQKLESLRVVDPACGSGAYLLGMLHELFVLNKNLDTSAHRASARDDYRRKLDIIQKNLYGVDLDDFAVHIARLRLWLSLVVEFDESNGEKPEPLPNLDFEIEIGNSLTSPDPSAQNPNLYREQIIECEKLKAEYSNYHEGGKREKAHAIETIQQEITDWLRASSPLTATDSGEPFDWLARFGEVFLPHSGFESTLDGRMAVIDKASTQPALAAPVEERAGGFDIVLANPPYGSDVAENVRWNFFNKAADGAQKGDPYALFLARGLQLLRPGGCLCYIVSNTWRTLKSHKPLRKRLAKNTRVEHLLDLPRWIFEATVDTGILTLVKDAPPENHQLIAADLSPLAKDDWSALEANLEAVASHGPDAQTLDYARYTYPQKLIESYDNFSFFIGSPRLYQLMSDARFEKLGAIAEVKQGLITADNDYYLRKRDGVRGSYEILDEAKLLSETEISKLSEVEKRDGVDPKKYGGRHFVPYDKGGESDAQGGWLPNYYVPTGYFIDWSKSAITRLRTQTSERQAGRIAARFQNQEFYFNQGISFSPTGAYSPTFRFSAGTIFGNKGSTIFLKSGNLQTSAGVLSSILPRYFLKSFLAHGVETGEEVLKRLPIPKLTTEQSQRLSTLVAQIIAKQKQNPRYAYYAHEQKAIDALVYELYGLDANDIREVELWYCRRYRKLADAQGVTTRVQAEYSDFLQRAEVLRSRPYRYWSSHPWLREIGKGEGAHADGNIEFKRQFAHAENKTVEAVAGFLNGAGGVLFLGVTDAGEPVGLAHDFSQVQTPPDDKLRLKIASVLESHLDLRPLQNVEIAVEEVSGNWLARIDVRPLRGSTPVYVDKKELFVRDGNRTLKLEGRDGANFIKQWPHFLARRDAADVKPRPTKIVGSRPAVSATPQPSKTSATPATPRRTAGKARLAPTEVRPIAEYSRDELIAVLKKVVKRKWILREDAIRESARVLGFARTGRQIQAAFKSAITGAIRRGVLEYDGDWIRRANSK